MAGFFGNRPATEFLKSRPVIIFRQIGQQPGHQFVRLHKTSDKDPCPRLFKVLPDSLPHRSVPDAPDELTGN